MPESATLPLVLIVEDEVLAAHALRDLLIDEGYAVALAETGQEAVRLAQELKPDVIVMDIRLPGETDGFVAALRIHELRKVPIIFLSGYPEKASYSGLARPQAWLLKPVSPEHVLVAVESALATWREREPGQPLLSPPEAA